MTSLDGLDKQDGVRTLTREVAATVSLSGAGASGSSVTFINRLISLLIQRG